MFDIGMTELLVIAVVAIIVVGPKDLPGLLRGVAKYVGQIRSMARDFQGQVNEAIKDAELDGLKSPIQDIGDLNPINQIKNDVSDIMDSTRSLDLPDEDYVAEGEAMLQSETLAGAEETADAALFDSSLPSENVGSDAQTSATSEKAQSKTKRKPAAKRAATKKTTAKKPAVKKTAAKTASKSSSAKTTAKKAVAKASS